jgi:hypothetical protein
MREESSSFCAECGRRVLVHRDRPSHFRDVVGLLGALLLGAWLLAERVPAIVAAAFHGAVLAALIVRVLQPRAPWRCSRCGMPVEASERP